MGSRVFKSLNSDWCNPARKTRPCFWNLYISSEKVDFWVRFGLILIRVQVVLRSKCCREAWWLEMGERGKPRLGVLALVILGLLYQNLGFCWSLNDEGMWGGFAFCGCVFGCEEIGCLLADPGEILFRIRVWELRFLGILIYVWSLFGCVQVWLCWDFGRGWSVIHSERWPIGMMKILLPVPGLAWSAPMGK